MHGKVTHMQITFPSPKCYSIFLHGTITAHSEWERKGTSFSPCVEDSLYWVKLIVCSKIFTSHLFVKLKLTICV